MRRGGRGGGNAGGVIAQPHALRSPRVAESAQHVRVPGPLNRASLAQQQQQPADAFDDAQTFGTPAGFWDEQISSRSYGQHSVEPRGREQVTRGFFEVKTEVRNLLRREGAGASELTVAAMDVAEEAQAIEERRRIRELFLMIDTDGSNTLEREEVEELLRGLGKTLDETAVDEAMSDMDRDGGGDISFNEFLEWWLAKGSKMGAQGMLNNATARRFIYDVPMFQQLVEPKFIAMLATMLKPQSYKRGDVIINRGEIGDAMYFMMTGTAAAQLDLEEDALAVGTLGPGSFFGEQAMIKDEPRNAYVKAVTDVEVLVLAKADMMRALESFPALVELMFKDTMEQRITTNEQRAANYQPSWTARQPIDPRARQPDDPKPTWHSRAEQHFEATAAQALPPNKATVVMPATQRLPEQRFAPCSPRRRTLTPRRSGDGGGAASGMVSDSMDGTDVDRRTAVFQRQIAQADHKAITGAAEMKFTPPWQQQAQMSPHMAAAQARVVPRVGGPASSWHNQAHPWTNGASYGR